MFTLGVSLRNPPQDGPPLISGVSLVVRYPIFTDFSDFLGRLSR